MSTFGSRSPVEGVKAGLVGYVVVALIFGVLHQLTGQSIFHFGVMSDDTLVFHRSVAVGAAPLASILAFNCLQLGAFLLFGWIAAWLVAHPDRDPGFLTIAAFAGLAGFFYSLSGFLGFGLDGPLAPSWKTVAAVNLLAGGLMAGYLLRGGPARVSGLSRREDEGPILSGRRSRVGRRRT